MRHLADALSEVVYETPATIRRRLEAELHEKRTQLHRLSMQIHRIRRQLDAIRDTDHFTIEVSDHAIVRYLERICGIERARFEAEILPPRVVRAIRELGTGDFPIAGGFTRAVRGTVVTVIDREGQGEAI